MQQAHLTLGKGKGHIRRRLDRVEYGSGQIASDLHPLAEAAGPRSQLEIDRAVAVVHEQSAGRGFSQNIRVRARHLLEQFDHFLRVGAVVHPDGKIDAPQTIAESPISDFSVTS